MTNSANIVVFFRKHQYYCVYCSKDGKKIKIRNVEIKAFSFDDLIMCVSLIFVQGFID